MGTQWLRICDNIYAKWNVQIAREISQTHANVFEMNSLKIRYHLNYDTEMALEWVRINTFIFGENERIMPCQTYV